MNLIRPILSIQYFGKIFRHIRAWQFVVFLSLPICSIAQEADPRIITISEKKLTEAERTDFVKLTTEVQSATYYQDDLQKNFGTFPVCFITDIKSMTTGNAQLTGPDIEAVIIKLTDSIDIGKKLDLSRFANFPKLRYIYFISEVEISKQSLSEMLINQSPSWTIVYTISKQT